MRLRASEAQREDLQLLACYRTVYFLQVTCKAVLRICKCICNNACVARCVLACAACVCGTVAGYVERKAATRRTSAAQGVTPARCVSK